MHAAACAQTALWILDVLHTFSALLPCVDCAVCCFTRVYAQMLRSQCMHALQCMRRAPMCTGVLRSR